MELAVSSWSDFKNILSNKNLLIQYYESSTNYFIWADDNNVTYIYRIWKSGSEPIDYNTNQVTTDRNDFINNFQGISNKKSGGRAKTTNPTAVADGSRVELLYDKIGRLVVVNSQMRDLVIKNMVTLTNTTETTVLATGGVGVFHDLTLLAITNTANQGIRIDIRDSTGGTIVFSINVAAGSSVVIPCTPSVPQTTANNNWTAKLSGAATDVRVTMVAEKNV